MYRPMLYRVSTDISTDASVAVPHKLPDPLNLEHSLEFQICGRGTLSGVRQQIYLQGLDIRLAWFKCRT